MGVGIGLHGDLCILEMHQYVSSAEQGKHMLILYLVVRISCIGV